MCAVEMGLGTDFKEHAYPQCQTKLRTKQKAKNDIPMQSKYLQLQAVLMAGQWRIAEFKSHRAQRNANSKYPKPR